MKRRLTSFLICSLVCMCFCSCKEQATTVKTVNQQDFEAVNGAIEKLENFETPYIISTSLEAPDGTVQFIECVDGDVTYTEYSVDSDGNYGTLAYASSESVTYALTDWCTEDGKYYMFYGNEDGTDSIYYLPDSYYNSISDRDVLYARKMLTSATSLVKQNDTVVNLGHGDETFITYKGVVPSNVVKEILGVNSWSVYSSVKEDVGTDDNTASLCGYYLADLDMNLTFSDGIVLFGIDKDGVLRYIVLEVGGLGSRMYLTKAVVEDNNPNLRQAPDFSTARPYAETMKELADYIASFPTYEDALNSLDSNIPLIEE